MHGQSCSQEWPKARLNESNDHVHEAETLEYGRDPWLLARLRPTSTQADVCDCGFLHAHSGRVFTKQWRNIQLRTIIIPKEKVAEWANR